MSDFHQPTLEGAELQPAGETVLVERVPVARVSNTGKTDELSLAVAAANAPKPTTLVEEPKPVGRFALEYEYNGEAIRETHATVRGAVARVQALKRLGIVPATSTAP